MNARAGGAFSVVAYNASNELRLWMREHERLMSAPPYPHDGWAVCVCELAQRIRKASK